MGLMFWLWSRHASDYEPVHAAARIIAPLSSIAGAPRDIQAPVVAPAKTIPDQTPAEVVRALLQAWDDDDNPDLRERRLSELAALLSGTNALDIIQSLPANLVGYAFAVPAVREKMLVDPAATLDWMSEHANVQGQLQTFLHDWGQSGRDVMQQTISDLPGGAWKETVLVATVNESMTTDPASAVGLAAQMDVPAQQNSRLDMAVTEWAKQDPATAAQWAHQSGGDSSQLFQDVADGLAGSNPQQAADFAFQFIPDGQALDDSIGQITWAWALQDPGAASAWLAQLPDGPLRQTAMQNLMSVWGNHDASAATAWVENLPDTALQSQAASALLPVVSR